MAPSGIGTWTSPSGDTNGPWAGFVAFVLVVFAYLFFAQLGLWLNDPVAAGAGLWPSAGITLAALLLLPTRSWGWVVAAVVVAELGGDLAHGYGLGPSLGWTVANVVEPLVGAYLLRRSAATNRVTTPIRSLLLFLTCGVIIGPLVGATVGSITTTLSFAMPLADVWPKFFIGDALGVLVVAPAVLALRAQRTEQARTEAIALGLVSLTTCAVVFSGWGGAWLATQPYLLMICLSWAALRFGLRGVSWLAFAITMIANVATAYGEGPFAQAGGPTGHSITLLQIFLAISVSCSLLLAASVDHVSEKERTEARWRHQATHDALTGLPNRSLFSVALNSALHHAGTSNPTRLVVCDLDNFKQVNDTWGHVAGDELLRVIAERMASSVRANDVVARISGDEFALLLNDADEAVAAEVANRVMAAVMVPVCLPSGSMVVPSISMGIAANDRGENVGQLMTRADATMYRAKALGGRQVMHS